MSFSQRDRADRASGVTRPTSFRPNKQMRALFTAQIPGILLTWTILALYVIILHVYESKKAATDYGKIVYNTLTTATLIALGLNFFEVFKSVAKVLRWHILSSRPHEPRLVDLVLGADSLLNCGQMVREFPRKPWILAFGLGWITLNLAAQIAVATVSLNASMDGGYNSSGITHSSDNVAVPKLDCFYSADGNCDRSNTSNYPSVAHACGEGSQQDNAKGCNYTGDALSAIQGKGRQDCFYFSRPDRSEFAVRFPDYDPKDTTRAYPYLDTGRILTVSAANCRSYQFPASPGPLFNDGWDGKDSELIYTFPTTGSADTGPLSIPRVSLAAFSTTYIWNGTWLPGTIKPGINSSEPILPANACGPRCVQLYALRDFYVDPETHNITTYHCEINISNVTNPTADSAATDVHMVPDDVARIAGTAISLTGRWRSFGPPDMAITAETIDWRQFQLYQDGADWAASPNDTAADIGARMAEFTAATLATMAQRNPYTQAVGTLPHLGNSLNVVWDNVWTLVAGMLVAARPVIVGDGSNLVVARTLADVVGELPPAKGEEARLARLNGKELAREVDVVRLTPAAPGAGAGEGEDGGEELRTLRGLRNWERDEASARPFLEAEGDEHVAP